MKRFVSTVAATCVAMSLLNAPAFAAEQPSSSDSQQNLEAGVKALGNSSECYEKSGEAVDGIAKNPKLASAGLGAVTGYTLGHLSSAPGHGSTQAANFPCFGASLKVLGENSPANDAVKSGTSAFSESFSSDQTTADKLLGVGVIAAIVVGLLQRFAPQVLLALPLPR